MGVEEKTMNREKWNETETEKKRQRERVERLRREKETLYLSCTTNESKSGECWIVVVVFLENNSKPRLEMYCILSSSNWREMCFEILDSTHTRHKYTHEHIDEIREKHQINEKRLWAKPKRKPCSCSCSCSCSEQTAYLCLFHIFVIVSQCLLSFLSSYRFISRNFMCLCVCVCNILTHSVPLSMWILVYCLFHMRCVCRCLSLFDSQFCTHSQMQPGYRQYIHDKHHIQCKIDAYLYASVKLAYANMHIMQLTKHEWIRNLRKDLIHTRI